MARDSAIVSKNMSKIHSKDTSIELQLRKALWHRGYRYRKNYKALPGSPDIVLTKYKIAIFCDSEFFMVKIGMFYGFVLKRVKIQITGLKKLSGIEIAIMKMIKNFSFLAILLFIFGDKILQNIQMNAYKLLKNLYGI